jgi:hypothetical protein
MDSMIKKRSMRLRNRNLFLVIQEIKNVSAGQKKRIKIVVIKNIKRKKLISIKDIEINICQLDKKIFSRTAKNI